MLELPIAAKPDCVQGDSIRDQAATLSDNITLAALSAELTEKKWETAMRLLPPPAKAMPDLAIGISWRAEYPVELIMLEHIEHALIYNTWRQALAPLILPGLDAMRALSVDCVFKAELLCASITADAVAAALLRSRWVEVVRAMHPQYQPDVSLAVSIAAQCGTLAATITSQALVSMLRSKCNERQQAMVRYFVAVKRFEHLKQLYNQGRISWQVLEQQCAPDIVMQRLCSKFLQEIELISKPIPDAADVLPDTQDTHTPSLG